MWEAGPYNWGIELSGGSVTFVAYDGPWDRAKPEVVLGDLSDWYLEPHYGFDVRFIPNTPYAEFYTEEADRASSLFQNLSQLS